MPDVWLFLLIVTAIGIGWYLGRYVKPSVKDQGSASYYKGLNYLLNEQPDAALDSFIDSLEVNSETLDTHLAVGNLMRRKGEVERAIRIHQNLLARPSLAPVHLHRAHLELAQDFISAGLLDRAEKLLEGLLDEAPELREITLRYLMEIYQDEKEWLQAIAAARRLLPRKTLLKTTAVADRDLSVALSHYCCEQAQCLMARNDYQAARASLREAIQYDRNCVRASLLLAEIEYSTGHYQQAISALRKIRYQNIDYLVESLNLLKKCFQQLGEEKAWREYLQQCWELQPSTTVLLEFIEDVERCEGIAAARASIELLLGDRPSLRGVAEMVRLTMAERVESEREDLLVLQQLIDQLMDDKPSYQCVSCGFSGKQLHWLCPSCKQWGQIKMIRGAEGD